jgi:EmrB/QacA subfamily drug resistance transporter
MYSRAQAYRRRFVARLYQRGTYRTWVLVAALAGMFANTFPFTILAVSLSKIADEFGTTETTMAWVITAPMLFSAVALPVLGKLGDLRGHRKVFLLGSAGAALIAFTTVFAWSALALIGLRTLAGIMGGTTQPSSMSLIFSTYPASERTRAMGWWSATGAAAPTLGLIAGGPLVDLVGWRILFALQGLFALSALLLAWLVLTETPRQRVRFDIPGAIALALTVAPLMFVLSKAGDLGFSSPIIRVGLVLGLVSLLSFVVIETRTAAPLLPLQFFCRRNFTMAILAMALQGAAYMGAFVLAPLLLVGGFGYSVSAAAGVMLFRPLALSLTSPIGGFIGEVHGERLASVSGTLSITLSMAMLAWGVTVSSMPWVLAGLVFQGIGQGMCMPSLTSVISSSVPETSLGIATAASRLLGQVGAAFGITFLTAIYGGRSEGFVPAFLTGLGLGALATGAASFVRSHPRDRRGPGQSDHPVVVDPILDAS